VQSSRDHAAALAVRTYLHSVIGKGRLTDGTLVDISGEGSNDLMIVLETPYLVAAFAFSGESPRKDYDESYKNFKKHYDLQRGKWDDLDLAFVFCVPKSPNGLDSFYSSVETNTVFCRKYIVVIGTPIGASLAHLPFLPLDDVKGQAIRPPSAQSYLESCGVPGPLVTDLVIPRRKGPDGIAANLLAGEYGELIEIRRGGGEAESSALSSGQEAQFVKQLTIKNFRAYR
jgi:hypothetical protein